MVPPNYRLHLTADTTLALSPATPPPRSHIATVGVDDAVRAGRAFLISLTTKPIPQPQPRGVRGSWLKHERQVLP